jgi:hypothetical protein
MCGIKQIWNKLYTPDARAVYENSDAFLTHLCGVFAGAGRLDHIDKQRHYFENICGFETCSTDVISLKTL